MFPEFISEQTEPFGKNRSNLFVANDPKRFELSYFYGFVVFLTSVLSCFVVDTQAAHRRMTIIIIMDENLQYKAPTACRRSSHYYVKNNGRPLRTKSPPSFMLVRVNRVLIAFPIYLPSTYLTPFITDTMLLAYTQPNLVRTVSYYRYVTPCSSTRYCTAGHLIALPDYDIQLQ